MASKTNIPGAEKLKAYMESWDQIDNQMDDLREELKEVKKQMKGEGFNMKAVMETRRLRKMKSADRQELRDTVDMHLQALGILD